MFQNDGIVSSDIVSSDIGGGTRNASVEMSTDADDMTIGVIATNTTDEVSKEEDLLVHHGDHINMDHTADVILGDDSPRGATSMRGGGGGSSSAADELVASLSELTISLSAKIEGINRSFESESCEFFLIVKAIRS